MNLQRSGLKKRKTQVLNFKLIINSLGIEQVPIDLKKDRPKKFYQPVPPYNGFGSEEDSLGSVYSLQPKPPRKDINKMFTVNKCSSIS